MYHTNRDSFTYFLYKMAAPTYNQVRNWYKSLGENRRGNIINSDKLKQRYNSNTSKTVQGNIDDNDKNVFYHRIMGEIEFPEMKKALNHKETELGKTKTELNTIKTELNTIKKQQPQQPQPEANNKKSIEPVEKNALQKPRLVIDLTTRIFGKSRKKSELDSITDNNELKYAVNRFIESSNHYRKIMELHKGKTFLDTPIFYLAYQVKQKNGKPKEIIFLKKGDKQTVISRKKILPVQNNPSLKSSQSINISINGQTKKLSYYVIDNPGRGDCFYYAIYNCLMNKFDDINNPAPASTPASTPAELFLNKLSGSDNKNFTPKTSITNVKNKANDGGAENFVVKLRKIVSDAVLSNNEEIKTIINNLYEFSKTDESNSWLLSNFGIQINKKNKNNTNYFKGMISSLISTKGNWASDIDIKILKILINEKNKSIPNGKNKIPQLVILSPSDKNINGEILNHCNDILLYYVNKNHYQSIICDVVDTPTTSTGGSKKRTRKTQKKKTKKSESKK